MFQTITSFLTDIEFSRFWAWVGDPISLLRIISRNAFGRPSDDPIQVTFGGRANSTKKRVKTDVPSIGVIVEEIELGLFTDELGNLFMQAAVA